jgi:TetR/AcrR family transcriptional regulator, regulator of cefoperazone and chloramphenicol sensitivity
MWRSLAAAGTEVLQKVASLSTIKGAQARPEGGYRKGEETRKRVLDAALRAFGASGFKTTTTRQIAEDADVSLPALKYYFGGKEGLYVACAHEIIGHYERRMLELVTAARGALHDGMEPPSARARLKEIVATLAELSIGADEAELWTSFVLREMTDQGPAFAVLYKRLWAPGVELVAGLVSRAMGEQTTSSSARIQALLLLSSLSAFGISRPVALKYLDWRDVKGERLAKVVQIVCDQIDRIGV